MRKRMLDTFTHRHSSGYGHQHYTGGISSFNANHNSAHTLLRGRLTTHSERTPPLGTSGDGPKVCRSRHFTMVGSASSKSTDTGDVRRLFSRSQFQNAPQLGGNNRAALVEGQQLEHASGDIMAESRIRRGDGRIRLCLRRGLSSYRSTDHSNRKYKRLLQCQRANTLHYVQGDVSGREGADIVWRADPKQAHTTTDRQQCSRIRIIEPDLARPMDEKEVMGDMASNTKTRMQDGSHRSKTQEQIAYHDYETETTGG